MDKDEKILKLARTMCRRWHQGQERNYTGEPYHVHPEEVERLLASVGASTDLRAAGLLHDVIEDCGATYRDIARMFGTRVADLVLMVTDVSRPEHGNREIRKELDRQHIKKADAEGKTLKLADLISNSPSIISHGKGFARKYMGEKKLLLEVLQEGHPVLYAQAAKIVDDYFSGAAVATAKD